jgi:large subunit ribosomal protein L25
MAREIADLTAEVRAGTGKGAARTARRAGTVPGIIYGGGVDPLPIQMNFNTLLKRLRQGRFLSSLFNLKVEGQPDVHVICRAVQRDVVKDVPLHVDFMRIKDDSRINLYIHVNFVNQDASPGLKRGGVLTVVRHEVELNVLAGDIPAEITVDMTGKVIGDVIHIEDVTLPAGTKATVARNFAVANLSAPSGLVSADNAAGPEVEAAEA